MAVRVPKKEIPLKRERINLKRIKDYWTYHKNETLETLSNTREQKMTVPEVTITEDERQ